MRLAVLSDIHGNLHALLRVLSDVEGQGADAIACLGDVATLGPRPRDVSALVRERAQFTILGNHDAYLLSPGLVDSHNGRGEGPLGEAVAWCREQVDGASLGWMRTFRERITIDLGRRELLLFHGSPESNLEELDAETRSARFGALAASYPADVMIGGHTHLQMGRKAYGRLFVNPGSVGLPFADRPRGGAPTILGHAEYAMVDASPRGTTVTLRQVALDGRRLRAQTREWNVALARELAVHYARVR